MNHKEIVLCIFLIFAIAMNFNLLYTDINEIKSSIIFLGLTTISNLAILLILYQRNKRLMDFTLFTISLISNLFLWITIFLHLGEIYVIKQLAQQSFFISLSIGAFLSNIFLLLMYIKEVSVD